MIVGERILEVSGKNNVKTPEKELSVKLSLEEVKKGERYLEITYLYHAIYSDDAGEIKIKGILLAKEDDKRTKEILDMWKESRQVPLDYASTIMTLMTQSGTTNGTIIAKVLGLVAPFASPNIKPVRKETVKKEAKK